MLADIKSGSWGKKDENINISNPVGGIRMLPIHCTLPIFIVIVVVIIIILIFFMLIFE